MTSSSSKLVQTAAERDDQESAKGRGRARALGYSDALNNVHVHGWYEAACHACLIPTGSDAHHDKNVFLTEWRGVIVAACRLAFVRFRRSVMPLWEDKMP